MHDFVSMTLLTWRFFMLSFQEETFIIEAVDIEDIEKVIMTKGPGRPIHVEKVVVKAGEFDSTEMVFNHQE